MTLAEVPALYEETIRGEPFERAVLRDLLDTATKFWTIGDWPIDVPAPVPHATPRLQRVISEIRGWTGWSARRLAEVADSSHTTILNAENGRPLVSAHSGDLRHRLLDLHDVVERTYLLAGRDPHQTDNLLTTASPKGRSAVQELVETGDAGRAYIAVLDALRPRQAGLFVADRPRQDGRTTALHE